MSNCSRCKHDYSPIYGIDTIQHFRDAIQPASGQAVVVVYGDEEYHVTDFRRINYSWSLLAAKDLSFQKPMTKGDLKAELKNDHNWSCLNTWELTVGLDVDDVADTIWGGVDRVELTPSTVYVFFQPRKE